MHALDVLLLVEGAEQDAGDLRRVHREALLYKAEKTWEGESGGLSGCRLRQNFCTCRLSLNCGVWLSFVSLGWSLIVCVSVLVVP